ncbi:hypothetical protein [Saccharothrix obliqua]|uniref:hypothetical protein n=1 Tax=Saccharothrix obliqua TaxID=2861747 RepID=UPI001C5F70EC|nr:hypothetical protein [Saccharothrix obliqua]MBW4717149.1 hypothetical protein [Saccharothrix obliqua]
MTGNWAHARRVGAAVALIAASAAATTGAPPASASPGGSDRPAAVVTGNAPISRAAVRERARSWIDERVPYSQQQHHTNQHGTYRQDCSGYVSMAWGMDASYTTDTLRPFMDAVDRSDLRTGDALWRHDNEVQHIALFVGWSDAARTQPVVWEERGQAHVTEQRVWSREWADTFLPRRYKNIIETPGA